MALLERELLDVFAGSSDDPAAFGVIGSFVESGGVVAQSAQPPTAEVAGTDAYRLGLWEMVEQGSKLPPLEEFNSLFFIITKAIKYMYQEGVPEWIAGETYRAGSIVKYNGVLYVNNGIFHRLRI